MQTSSSKARRQRAETGLSYGGKEARLLLTYPIRASRVRELMDLVFETLEVGPAQRRQHVVERAAGIFSASAVVMVGIAEYFPAGQNRVFRLSSVGFSGNARERYLGSIAQSVCGDPMLRKLGTEARVRTYRRADRIGDSEWYAHSWVCEEHREADLDDGLYSARPLEDDKTTEGIGLHRSVNDRPFSEEDQALLHLLNLEGRRLFRAPPTLRLSAATRALPPRQLQTLELLCGGASEKEVANALQISPNTVHAYVKALYRHFEVSTRAELLVRCLGDRLALEPTDDA